MAVIDRPRPLAPFTFWLVRYRRGWRASIVPSVVAPALYLVVFGKLVGRYVPDTATNAERLGGVDYAAFVAPGVMAAAAMLVATSEAGFPVLTAVGRRRTYVGMLHAPITVGDLVAGHLLWIGARLAVVAVALAGLLVALDAGESPWVVLAIPASVLCGLAFAGPLMAYTARQEDESGLLAWMRFGATPMLLFGGVFYATDHLPTGLRLVTQLTPLWHGVALCRSLSLGTATLAGSAGHLAYLGAFAGGGAWLATRSIRTRVVG